MSLLVPPLASAASRGGQLDPGLRVFAVVMVVLGLLALVILLKYGRLWIMCLSTGVPLGLFHLVGMSLRGTPPRMIVENLIMAHKAGVRLKPLFLEAHHLARGDVPTLTRALVMAHQGKTAVVPDDLAALILAGGNADRVVTALIVASKKGVTLSMEEASKLELSGEGFGQVLGRLEGE